MRVIVHQRVAGLKVIQVPGSQRVGGGRNGNALMEIIREAERKLAHHPAVCQVVELGDGISVVVGFTDAACASPEGVAGGRAVERNRRGRVGHIPNLEGQVNPFDVVFRTSGWVKADISLGVGGQDAADVVNPLEVGLGGGHGRADCTILHNGGIGRRAALQVLLSLWHDQSLLHLTQRAGRIGIHLDGSQRSERLTDADLGGFDHLDIRLRGGRLAFVWGGAGRTGGTKRTDEQGQQGDETGETP